MNQDIEALQKLTEYSTQDLLAFFDQHKRKTKEEKIIAIFNLVNVNLSLKTIKYIDYETPLRNFQGLCKPDFKQNTKVHGNDWYNVGLWINRLLNWNSNTSTNY